MTQANCPSCGGPIVFSIGSSAVVVCDYCRTVVARKDRDIENLGKVAELVDTGSPLRRDLTGRFRGQGFRIVGRTQMHHEAGGLWDEWYAAFDDGRWGWLAEAQGRYYLTFETAASGVTPFEKLNLGDSVPAADGMIVAEFGTATGVAAEGEIPWKFVPGSQYQYADLSGTDGRFATIDYSEDEPLVFKGRLTDLDELGILAEPSRQTRVSLEKLSCSNCGGALELRAPDRAERVVCPNCGGMHDVSEGKLAFLRVLKRKKIEPKIPLGATGRIDGVPYVVAGFMERSVRFDKNYYWTEYLLFQQQKGFRWLVHSDDHWSFVEGVPVAEVEDDERRGVANHVRHSGRRYRIFQQATAKVTYVLGEFYWKVENGEAVESVDYIAPPFGLSKETTRGSSAAEVNYSFARYMPVEEVERAFGVTGLPRPTIVGPLQPAPQSGVGKMWAMFAAAILIVALLVGMTRSNRVVLRESFDLTQRSEWSDESAPDNMRIVFTPPFQLSGGKNLMIRGRAQVNNDWVWVAGDLVNEGSGTLESFELPIEFFEGYDEGEKWSEGKRERAVYLSAQPAGSYALRFEAQWNKGSTPPPLEVEVREGVFRWSHLLIALIVGSLLPLIAAFRLLMFEMERWKDSAHSPFGTTSDDDDE